MSYKAQPIVEAYFEEGKKHGESYSPPFEKRVQEIKKQSLTEKKAGCLLYRQNMEWAGLKTQEDFDAKTSHSLREYQNGGFFLERIGRFRSVDAPLSLTLLALRTEWIREYDIKTMPEFVLLDMALTSYFHFIRLNEAINNIMASIEWDFFALDSPTFKTAGFPDKSRTNEDNKAVVEELAYRLKEILQPALEQYNRMFIRNLRALRDIRRGNILLNVAAVEQMNIGNKQINVTQQATT